MKPSIKHVGDDDKKVPVLSIYPERYKEDDLVLDYLYKNNDSSNDNPPFDVSEESDSDNSMDWLNAL